MRSVTDSMKHPDGSPLVVAHRGYHSELRENTLEAFEAAADLGADMVELDVWRTADGELVVYHNPALDTEEPWIPPERRDKYTLVSHSDYPEIVDACSDRGFRPPTLGESLDLCRDRVGVDVEIKEPGFERDVHSAIGERGMEDSVVVTSFYDEAVEEYARLAPGTKTGLLLGVPDAEFGRRFSEIFPGRRLSRCGAGTVAPHWKLCLPGYVRVNRILGRAVFVWTVNEESRMRRLMAAGVDGLITDRPELALDIRKG